MKFTKYGITDGKYWYSLNRYGGYNSCLVDTFNLSMLCDHDTALLHYNGLEKMIDEELRLVSVHINIEL